MEVKLVRTAVPGRVLPMVFIALLLPATAVAQVRPVPRSQQSTRAPFLQQVKSFEETQYVSKVVLKNGLRVLVNEYHTLPVASVLTRVSAGYETEPPDTPGISLVLERMLFRGTPSRSVGVIRQDTQALGGTVGGSVAYDHASLETVVPSMQWKKALEIQADMLLNPSFDPVELKSEIELTLSELRGEQDRPDLFARQKLLETGFSGRGLYRWTAKPESLRGLTREKLLAYYNACYTPTRTILVVAGDISTTEVLNEVVKLYDKPKAVGAKPIPAGEESKQDSFRYSEVRGAVQIPRILFGFHTPGVTSEDYPALEVLRAMLGVGEGSVLAVRLRDQKKIIDAGSADLQGYSNLGYLSLQMTAALKDIDKCEIAALTELELIKRKEPEAADFKRALAQLERMYWERLQNVSGRASLLAFHESLGDWKGMNRYVARLRQVKPEDVSAVAKKYLRLENCSLLEFLPGAGESRNLTSETAFRTFHELLGPSVDQEAAERERETRLSLDIPAGEGSYKFSEIRFQFQTASVLRGPDLFIKEDHSSPLIQMGFLFPGGKLMETEENSGVTELMLRTMLRGTQDIGPDRYLRQMELYGGLVTPVVADDYSGFFLSVLSSNVDAALQLLGEAVKTPKFDKDEFGRQKQLQMDQVRMRVESVSRYPDMLLNQSLFKGHPYAPAAEGTEKSLAGIDADAVRQWYQNEFRNKKPLVVILGDTQGTTLAGYFVKNFSGSRFQELKLPEAFAKPLEQKTVIEKDWEKNQSLVLVGFQAPPEGDEDAFAVAVLESFFCGSGGKLPIELIDKQGLAYRVTMDYEPRIRGGSIVVAAAMNPGNEQKVTQAIWSEFGKFLSTPPFYRDYRSAVNTAIGKYWIEKQSRFAQIVSLAEIVLSGKDLDAFQAYLTRIQDVKQDDLQEVARRIFKLDRAVTLDLHGGPAN